jgi:hypothetical protein
MMTLGFFILLLTPPAMEVANFRRENIVGNLKDEGKKAVEEINRGQVGARGATPPPAGESPQ